MALYLGGFISPPILLEWTPIGNYQDYLSVDKKYFYITLKDNKRQDTQWGRITTFKYDFKGKLIETGVFNNPSPVTTNQDDWRKKIAHSYLANPPNDPNACINQYAFYGYSNIHKTKDKLQMYTFDPEQKLKDGGNFQDKVLTSNASVKVGVSDLSVDATTCKASAPTYIKNVKVKSLEQTEVALLSAAAIQID